MIISKAKNAIKELYKLNIVTALISERGVGKTSAYKQCAKELGIGYIDLYAAALEGPDFMGLPTKNPISGITEYLPPQFLPTVEAVKAGLYPESGILVLEEINRVSTETTSVLYPLLLDRKINGHELAKGWSIGVTMNPDNMNYMVNTLDDAIIDRFISISIEPSITDYIEYSRSSIHNELVINFLENYPDMLLVVNSNSTSVDKFPTPRGWTQVQIILNSCNLDDDSLLEVVSGIVGVTASTLLFGHKKNYNSKLPSSTDILNNYSLVRGEIKAYIKSGSIDYLTKILSSIISKDELLLEKVKNFNSFLNDLPEELKIYFYKEISIKKPDTLATISEKLDSYEDIIDQIIDLIAG